MASRLIIVVVLLLLRADNAVFGNSQTENLPFHNLEKEASQEDLLWKFKEEVAIMVNLMQSRMGAMEEKLNSLVDEKMEQIMQKVIKMQLSNLESKISTEFSVSKNALLEVSNKISELEEEANKSKNAVTGMLQTAQEKIQKQVLEKVDDVLQQLLLVYNSTTASTFTSEENQEYISFSASSFGKSMEDMLSQLTELGTDVQETNIALQTIESQITAAVAIAIINITTAVEEIQISMATKMSISDFEDELSSTRKGIKEHISGKCGLKAMSVPANCAEIRKSGELRSGIYTITILSYSFRVYCDMQTDGGGWTVIQRRDDVSPHTSFHRYWYDYKVGFGDLSKEFWLGLDAIHLLTSQKDTSLRMDLEDWNGVQRFAKYERFSVGDETKNYRLSIKLFSGNAGNSLICDDGNYFSTRDKDNDYWSHGQCAQNHRAGWWFGGMGERNCHYSNLNGEYLRGNHNFEPKNQGIHWYEWKGHSYSLKKSQMKVRPAYFKIMAQDNFV